jgi:hypothetical protein
MVKKGSSLSWSPDYFLDVLEGKANDAVDNTLRRLYGKSVKDLGPVEQMEVRWAIKEALYGR